MPRSTAAFREPASRARRVLSALLLGMFGGFVGFVFWKFLVNPG